MSHHFLYSLMNVNTLLKLNNVTSFFIFFILWFWILKKIKKKSVVIVYTFTIIFNMFVIPF